MACKKMPAEHKIFLDYVLIDCFKSNLLTTQGKRLYLYRDGLKGRPALLSYSQKHKQETLAT